MGVSGVVLGNVRNGGRNRCRVRTTVGTSISMVIRVLLDTTNTDSAYARSKSYMIPIPILVTGRAVILRGDRQ